MIVSRRSPCDKHTQRQGERGVEGQRCDDTVAADHTAGYQDDTRLPWRRADGYQQETPLRRPTSRNISHFQTFLSPILILNLSLTPENM